MASLKIENSTFTHLQMPLTTQSKFNYLYNISTILELEKHFNYSLPGCVITSDVGIIP